MMARGGWVNTIHGNLEFLDEPKARWFRRVQHLYEKLQAEGRTKSFGGVPGNVEPYGFASLDSSGAVYTVVNPAQAVGELELPMLSRVQTRLGAGRIIFRDAGFAPVLHGNRIVLGPGQMAAVGFRRYADPAFDFGVQEDVVIARTIAPVEANFEQVGKNAVQAVVPPPVKGDLRILFQQRDEHGNMVRSWPGGPPNGKSVGTVLKIVAEQNGKALPVDIQYDKLIWSGLSWGAGEIRRKDFSANLPITIRCSSEEKGTVKLEGHLYEVEY
jgi:hypothetical protein